MRFEMIATLQRTVEDTVDLAIEAENEDEAMDMAYDIVNNPMTAESRAVRCLVTNRHFHEPEFVTVNFKGVPVDAE